MAVKSAVYQTKNSTGGYDEYSFRTQASSVVEDANHRFTTDEEKASWSSPIYYTSSDGNTVYYKYPDGRLIQYGFTAVNSKKGTIDLTVTFPLSFIDNKIICSASVSPNTGGWDCGSGAVKYVATTTSIRIVGLGYGVYTYNVQWRAEGRWK